MDLISYRVITMKRLKALSNGASNEPLAAATSRVPSSGEPGTANSSTGPRTRETITTVDALPTSMPGAFAVAGIRAHVNSSSDEDEDPLIELGGVPDEETPALPSAEVVDEDSLRRQILSKEVFAHAERVDEKRRNARRLVIALVLAVVLSVVLGTYFGTKNDGGSSSSSVTNALTAPSISPMPSISPRPSTALPSVTPTAAPTRLVWKQVGDDINGYWGNPCCGSGEGGSFGSAVSLSNDGSVLAVGWGENQFYYFRARALGAIASNYVVNMYNCVDNGCEEIGKIEHDYYTNGYISLSVSGDGSRVAVADGNFVNVYSSSAVPVGENSTLLQSQDNNQTVVSLSNTGDILAVLEKDSGLVVIYEYQEDRKIWQQLGQTIRDQEEVKAQQSLSLSSIGNVVAIGADFFGVSDFPQNLVEGLYYGGINVRVFGYAPTSGNWTQIGSDIEGEAYESMFSEQSISLSSDGNIIAIGTSERNIPPGPATATRMDTGRVRVFRLSEGSWVQMGRTLSGGTDMGDMFGVSVSLSNDGMTMVIGSSGDSGNGRGSGKTKVYWYDGDDWVQLGPDLVGMPGDSSGQSVAISGDGSTVAVGAPNSEVYGSNAGTARVFNLGGSSL